MLKNLSGGGENFLVIWEKPTRYIMKGCENNRRVGSERKKINCFFGKNPNLSFLLLTEDYVLVYNSTVQGYNLTRCRYMTYGWKEGFLCWEHISLKSSTERRSTASERECQHLTAERFLPAEEQRAERDFLIDLPTAQHSCTQANGL